MQIWAVAPVKHTASKFCSGRIDYESKTCLSQSQKAWGEKTGMEEK